MRIPPGLHSAFNNQACSDALFLQRFAESSIKFSVKYAVPELEFVGYWYLNNSDYNRYQDISDYYYLTWLFLVQCKITGEINFTYEITYCLKSQ